VWRCGEGHVRSLHGFADSGAVFDTGGGVEAGRDPAETRHSQSRCLRWRDFIPPYARYMALAMVLEIATIQSLSF
jgi:hypothetical protein